MALRGRPPSGKESWMEPVAELMVQEGMSFSSACQALGTKWENSAAERAAQYCEPFRNILDALEFRYFSRTGSNPMLTKEFLAGGLIWAIRRLREQDQPEKVALPGKLLADIMGWYPESDASEQPVLANLTQKDIDELKAKVAAEAKKRLEEAEVAKVATAEGKPN